MCILTLGFSSLGKTPKDFVWRTFLTTKTRVVQLLLSWLFVSWYANLNQRLWDDLVPLCTAAHTWSTVGPVFVLNKCGSGLKKGFGLTPSFCSFLHLWGDRILTLYRDQQLFQIVLGEQHTQVEYFTPSLCCFIYTFSDEFLNRVVSEYDYGWLWEKHFAKTRSKYFMLLLHGECVRESILRLWGCPLHIAMGQGVKGGGRGGRR